MKCPSCGWKNPATVTFCRQCGTPLASASANSPLTAFPASEPLAHQKTQPPRARQKGWRWVLWVVVACLLLGGAGISWWAISLEQTRAGVIQTLQTYCNALQQADYTQAYAQWSNTIQMSEPDFASLYTNKPHITGCSMSTISLADTTAQATLTMLFADGSTTSGQYTLILIHGVWKIKSQLSR